MGRYARSNVRHKGAWAQKAHNLANSTSSFKNGLKKPFSSTSFYCQKGEKCFFKFGHFFSKCKFSRLWHFFLTYWLPNQLNVSVAVHVYKIQVFDEAFFALDIRMPMATKLSRALIFWAQVSFINMHYTSKGWYCGITWKKKCISLPACMGAPN